VSAGAQGRRDAGGHHARGSGICLALALFCAAAPLRLCVAQAPTYTAAHLTCATFEVRVRTNVTTELQGRRRVEEIRRDGILRVTGREAEGGIAIEAWWDSLQLSRRAEGRTLTPDADGILGGRYTGLLGLEGGFRRNEAPWVPDEIAEVSDLTVALDDLFPVFAPGTVRQLADSAGRKRFRLSTSRQLDAPADSTRGFAVAESETSDGFVVWGTEGVLRWDRTVTAETRVRETPRRSFRSVIVQRITVTRLGSCAGG
jgi:hypothetical protein